MSMSEHVISKLDINLYKLLLKWWNKPVGIIWGSGYLFFLYDMNILLFLLSPSISQKRGLWWNLEFISLVHIFWHFAHLKHKPGLMRTGALTRSSSSNKCCCWSIIILSTICDIFISHRCDSKLTPKNILLSLISPSEVQTCNIIIHYKL